MSCAQCGLCCHYWSGVEVTPRLNDFDKLVPKDLLEPFRDCPGILSMKMIGWPRRCAALRRGRCSIYDTRPKACRDFLCSKAGGEHVLPVILRRSETRKLAPRSPWLIGVKDESPRGGKAA